MNPFTVFYPLQYSKPPSLLRGNDPLDLPLGLETIPVLFTDTLTSLVMSNQRQQNLFHVAWKMGL